VASPSTDNFIGEQGQNPWSFVVGTKVNYFVKVIANQFVTRRGVITTTDGGLIGGHRVHISADEGYRSLHFIELSRPVFATPASLVTYAYGQSCLNAASVQFSFSKRGVLDVLSTNPVPVALGVGNGGVVLSSNNQTNSISFDESTGPLDTVNISWPNSLVPLEIAAIGVRKVM